MSLFRQVTLEPLFISRMHEIGRFVGDTASVQVAADIYDSLLVQFQAQVLAGRTGQGTYVQEFKTPASWWQHLKHSHAPGWFTRRWPVRFTTAKIKTDWKQFAAYPKADMGLPTKQFGYPVTIPILEPPTTIGSDWDFTQRSDEPSKPAYVSRPELAYKLYDTKALQDLENWGRYQMNALGPSPRTAIEAVLGGLAELGVNPDELLRTTS